VAPVRHVAGLDELGNEQLLDLLLTVRKSIGILKETMRPEGFNVGLNLGHVAGAGIEEHIHFHVVPRWNGDTNYMTILDDVRVIPEHIQKTYEKLRPDFERI
jgi:ATP adenylyltransferase